MPSPIPFAGRLLPRRDQLRAMLDLALPVVIIQVGIMSMGVVDTVMVGHLSRQALAAVALGNLYFFVPAVFSLMHRNNKKTTAPEIKEPDAGEEHPAEPSHA